MSDHYRQPIAVFGMVLPILFVVVIAGLALYANSDVNAAYMQKKVVYEKSQEASRKHMALLGEANANKKLLDAWDHMMKNETRATFLEHLKKAEKNFSGKELTKTAHNWVNYSDGLGKGYSQPSSQVKMSYMATYRAMQTVLMQMETILPNMQLDALEITRQDEGAGLKFDTTFTVWTLK